MLVLESTFPSENPLDVIGPYHPNLVSLFHHYVDTVYAVCSPFTTDLDELGYVVAACWPSFVEPILEDWRSQTEQQFILPDEESRVRLIRQFTSSFQNALESLYPRSMNASDWSRNSMQSTGLRLSEAVGRIWDPPTGVATAVDQVPEIPQIAVFIVMAAFLASYNPGKSDVRIFSRTIDGSRKRKKGGGTKKARAGGAVKVNEILCCVIAFQTILTYFLKVPQHLQGPGTFPLERLIAILGSLLQEYGTDELPTAQPLGSLPVIEDDVFRVQVWSNVSPSRLS